jgi:hypothetical protein
MRRVMAAVLVTWALGSASAFAGNLELRLGGFFPKADSLLFQDNNELFRLEDSATGVKKSDWAGFTGGLEYSWRTSGPLEIGVHLDAYSRTLDTAYVKYKRASGGPIFQTLRLDTVPLGATARFVTGDKHSRFQLYAGVGADLVFWEYTEDGSFIDFGNDFEIVEFDEFKSHGASPALHGVAGLRVGLNEDILFTAEGKYLKAVEQDMGEDFNNRIDVSGASVTVGVHVRF